MRTRLEIAEELLGCLLVDGLYAHCPGEAKHSKTAPRDFRVLLDGAPTAYCFHSSCGADVDDFNKRLRTQIWKEENGGAPTKPNPWNDGVAAEPRHKKVTKPPIDLTAVANFTRGVEAVDYAWFSRRSAVDVTTCGSGEFLDALYEPEDRILIFTEYYSQGNFLHWCGKGAYRLGKSPGVKAVASAYPRGAEEGVWFMVQPVSGKWEINPKPSEKGAKYTRRSEVNVTRWRYFVLENDKLDPQAWLKVVANLPLPIAAIYTSGGRSVHVLVRCEVPSKAEWDACRNVVMQLVAPLGADPAALTAVRLSRLPGCMRGANKQRLIYLNPMPEEKAIRLLTEVRE